MFFPVLRTPILLALLLSFPIAALAQVNPANSAPVAPCEPPGAPTFAGLRVFNGTQPVPLVRCTKESPATCNTELLNLAKPEEYQGDLIAPGTTQDGWSCAMVGGWHGWVPADRLAPVPATPAITTQQWLGTWANGHIGTSHDRLVLTRSPAGHGIVHVNGKAYYTNIAHNTSSGDLDGDALAMGPFLHILDQSDQPGCILDLTYNPDTQTIRAVDNQLCGGFNVTFNGVWRRLSAKR